MTNSTKLDRLRENKAAADIRRKNIDELRVDLKEAQAILFELPRGTYQAETDRRELIGHISTIHELIEDEERALENLLSDPMGRAMGILDDALDKMQ